jgi:hypothetical protein
MATKWLSASVAVSIVVIVAVHAAASAQDKVKAPAAPTSCSESKSVKSDKPQPELGPVCIVDICKLDNGVLYHCTSHVCLDKCCRYDTSLDCTPDPNCTFTIPPYCSSLTSCPPNACKRTCGPHTCGNENPC